jgi:endoglucanase
VSLAALVLASACGVDDTVPPIQDKLELGGCKREHVIDDGEDNNHRVLVQSDRGGYMYTFVDDSGSTITPTAGSQGGVFAFHIGGANGSMLGARFYGKLAAGDLVFAGYGMNLKEPKDGFDASAYDGISFFARREPNTLPKMRLKVPDTNTDGEGGVCTECYNDFGMDINVTEDWEQYIVPFAEMTQMPYWGNPRPTAVESKALYAVQFQVNSPGATYDLWVDDITFYGCHKDKKADADKEQEETE